LIVADSMRVPMLWRSCETDMVVPSRVRRLRADKHSALRLARLGCRLHFDPGQMMAAIRYETENGIARLVIDQPEKMNAMTYEMWASLPGLVARAEADRSVRAIVVTGEGGRAFCAGADISQFGAMREGESATAAYDAAYLQGCTAVSNADKPSIAVIRGVCFGGGVGLAMACDLRLARADCRFRVPAARLGLGYAYAGIELLARRLGLSVTADLMLSARIVAGEEALRLGIVNALWDAESFEREAADYLARIAANAPLTLRAVKLALIALARPEADRDTSAAEAAVAACLASADYREGQRAFTEKREPVFTGE
jgi:enoyl-CoA hydratase/carnithine racemase